MGLHADLSNMDLHVDYSDRPTCRLVKYGPTVDCSDMGLHSDWSDMGLCADCSDMGLHADWSDMGLLCFFMHFPPREC